MDRQMNRQIARWTVRLSEPGQQSDQNYQNRWANIWLTCLKYSWLSFFAWFKRSACPFNTLIFHEKFSIACKQKKKTQFNSCFEIIFRKRTNHQKLIEAECNQSFKIKQVFQFTTDNDCHREVTRHYYQDGNFIKIEYLW